MVEYNAYLIDVEWYNEIDNSTEHDKVLVTAIDYAEAMSQINEWYGNDNIIYVHIEYLHELPIRIDDSIAKQLKELNDF